MGRLMLLGAALLICGESALAQQKAQSPGVTAAVKLEEAVSGYLVEMNGKYKLRATEVTLAPGAYIDVHHHAGPGIRRVLSGELTFIQAGKATVYKAGDYFYESGNVVHTAQNKSKAPAKLVFFEVLPLQWQGSSSIPPRSQ